MFTLVVTRQVLVNPTQVLAGSSTGFDPDEWRLGFDLTRQFSF